MSRGESVHYVSAATGTAAHRPLPLANPDEPRRTAHAPQTKRPAGLDWSTITPRCTRCRVQSGALNFDDLCPRCAAPGTANDPTRLMRKIKPGECTECGRESRFLHDGECPLCRGETTELVLADRPEPVRPRTGRPARPAAQSSPRTPQPSATPRVDALAALIGRVEDKRSRPATIDRPLTPQQTQTIADAYHHDLVSIDDLAARHQITIARVRHIITRAGYPIRGRGDLNRRITQALTNLGTTSRDVKSWALDQGLTRGISRGTIAPAILKAYVAAHPTTTKELSS